MEAILQSIKPQYCELIAAGKKTVEVRKTRPKLETPFKVYIYQSTETRLTTAYKKGETTGYKDDDGNDILFDEFVPVRKWTFNQRKVIGEYVCDYIREYPYIEGEEVGEMYYDITTADGEATGLTYPEFAEYGKGKTLYGWHISNLVIYDKPKELSEFRTIDKEYLTKCPYRSRIYNNPDYTNGALLKGSYVCVDDGEPDFCRGQCEGAKKPLTRPPQSWCYVEEEKYANKKLYN